MGLFYVFRGVKKVVMLGFCAVFVSAVTPGGVQGVMKNLGVATAEPTVVTVSQVIRGDTIGAFVVDGGQLRNLEVRMIGINAPEISACYGIQAREYTLQQIGFAEVKAVPDLALPQKEELGRYQAYVYTPKGKNLNLELLRNGYARMALPQGKHFKMYKEFVEAQNYAQLHELGIWKYCGA